VAILGINLAFCFSWQTLAFFGLALAAVLLPSIVPAVVIRLLPKKWFSGEQKIYQVKSGEVRFYEKIGIRRWKDHISEMGKTANFSKAKIEKPNDPEYIARFVTETCQGEILHICCAILGIIGGTCLPYSINLKFGLPIAIVYAVINLISVTILRYTRPKLLRVLKLLQKRTNREQNSQVADK
jgi:Na+-translocating ferredoxin:NAD+ oxidoreductase RnfD subunit